VTNTPPNPGLAQEPGPRIVDDYRRQRVLSPERVACLDVFGDKVCDMLQFLLTVSYLDEFLRLVAGDDPDLSDEEAENGKRAIREVVREFGLMTPEILDATAEELRGFLPTFQRVMGGKPDFDDPIVNGLVVGIVRQRLGIYSLRLGDPPTDDELLRDLEAQADQADANSARIREILATSHDATTKVERILALS
jgi:hypothetical protein